MLTAEQYQQHQEQLVLMQKQLEQSQLHANNPTTTITTTTTNNTQVSDDDDDHGCGCGDDEVPMPVRCLSNMMSLWKEMFFLFSFVSRRLCPRRWTRPVHSLLLRPSSPQTSCWPSSPKRTWWSPVDWTGSWQVLVSGLIKLLIDCTSVVRSWCLNVKYVSSC